jgi:GNAT superfamily N-acetyltransferase
MQQGPDAVADAVCGATTFWKNARREARMSPITVRLGKGGDVDAAASVYERSNLARRQGYWPSRSARVAQVTAKLHDAAHHDTASWFLIGREGSEAMGMALIHPFCSDGGSGDVIVGAWFLNLIYVLVERWGKSIGGMLLDAVIEEAKRRGCHRIFLWTHERQNERAHRLYRSRGFVPTGHTMHDDEGQLIGEWCCECEQA